MLRAATVSLCLASLVACAACTPRVNTHPKACTESPRAHTAPSTGEDLGTDLNARREDLAFLCQVLQEDYVYVAKKLRRPADCVTRWGPTFDAADTSASFVTALEQVLAELHDHHVGLKTHQDGSPLLVPTHADLWIEVVSGRATITSVRPNSPAEAAGVRTGDVVLDIAGRPVDAFKDDIETAVDSTEALAYALRVAAAGTRGMKTRSLRVQDSTGAERDVEFPTLADAPSPSAPVTSNRIGDVGYIRIQNALGDSGLIAAFDEALDGLADTRGLILDLRDTPSGGNTDVAEPLMGRLVAEVAAYQRILWSARHEGASYPRIMISAVAPRLDRPRYTQPVVVLVSRWTGSMGEGIAVGLEGMGRAHVVGTPMARLAGAVESYALPRSQIGFQLPVGSIERINGAPREAFVPADDPTDGTGPAGAPQDPWVARALAWIDTAPIAKQAHDEPAP